MRTKLIAANWKMHKTTEEVDDFITRFSFKEALNNHNVRVLICPSFLYLPILVNYYQNKGILVGAQNVSEHESGAFTGEISASMLRSMDIDYCIIGHSERRKYFNETDEQLAAKINISLKHNIIPVFCCGEQIEQRNEGKHFSVVEQQIQNALFHLDQELFEKVVIAYEPVWAIGTGVNATSAQAQEMHTFIRSLITTKFGSNISQNTLILYGGSCNSSNAAELFSCEDVDGGLVGGASLNPEEFLKIIKAANE